MRLVTINPRRSNSRSIPPRPASTGARFIKICIEEINHLAKAHSIPPEAANFTATPSAPPDTHKGHTAQNRANAGQRKPHRHPPDGWPGNCHGFKSSTPPPPLLASRATVMGLFLQQHLHDRQGAICTPPKKSMPAMCCVMKRCSISPNPHWGK